MKLEKEKGSRKAARSEVKIKAHKGGRTARLEARLTPQEKETVMAAVLASGLSVADWLMAQVKHS
jgi:hypothetical protein